MTAALLLEPSSVLNMYPLSSGGMFLFGSGQAASLIFVLDNLKLTHFAEPVSCDMTNSCTCVQLANCADGEY